METCPVWRLPSPVQPSLDPGSIKPGWAGPGQDHQAWILHPGNLMTNSSGSGSSQSEPWKTIFKCSWITILLLSLSAYALTSPALWGERWQNLQLVIRGHLSGGINKLNNAAEVNKLSWFITAGSINKIIMDLFLLLKSDNRIDNQLKVSFLRKKWIKPIGKSLPPKQRKVVFVSAKILFTQKSSSWSRGSPQEGCLNRLWPFSRVPAHHAHRETLARATEELRHLHCT